ncbi:hypothetical protein Gpo141_00006732 [Globisporangium polare]
MASSTEANESYKHMESPVGTHAIRMDFSNHMETMTASQKDALVGGIPSSGGVNEKTLYDHDLVMIFPRREGGELKKPEEFTINAFVALLTGKDRHRSKRHGKIMIDPFARILRTKRCFLDDAGHDPIPDDADNDHSEKAEQSRLITEERVLEDEYEKVIGSRQPTTEVLFCELVAMTIARRVQLACGLTTRMFRSCDDDEIIMTIKADDNDLRVEADRINYRLQVSNKPFDMWAHGDKNNIVRQEIGDEEWRKSIEHLRHIRGSPHEDSEFPEMDPLLMSRGDDFHPKLNKALKVWGHTEEADGQFVPDASARAYKGGIMERFWSSLFGMAYDPMTYFSAFADYRHEAQYQPYYRRYPIQWGGTHEETLFTQKDRIRLASGIVMRHINTDALLVSRYITGDMFALHDEAALKELRSTWALHWLMLNQPLNKIRFYFGEKIALYFAWLGFYTKMLIFPSIAGIITYAVIETQDIQKGENQGYILIAFAVFIVIWSSVFAEVWKRKNGLFNSLWGLHGFHRSFRYRAQFRGTKSYNPITDAEEMTYESKAKRRRAFLISMVVVLMMVCIVCVALFALFLLKHAINEQDTYKKYKVDAKYRSSMTMGVTGLNAIQILILNTVYRGVAKKLNDLENHRTDREYENHLVIKVFLFQFCNSFASFFYIAFVKRAAEGKCLHNDDCMSELRDQLLILFLIRIIVGNTLEVVVPYLKYQFQLYRERHGTGNSNEKVSHNYIEEQAKLMPYEHNEAFEDYNEMVIQYGFITLFVVAFPLTPLLALANNIAEVHVDSVKLCFVHRRPFPHPAKSIGAWFYILRFMSYIALGTNCALILWTSPLFEDSSMSDTTKAFVFVVSCQVCLMLAVFIERAIPDVPQQLKLLMQRHENIVATVFKGMDEGDDSKLYETAEVVDLTIHPNELWEDKQLSV